MPDYIIKSDAKQTSTLGKVKVLVEQVVGQPSQAQISQAVADYIDSHPGALSPLSQATKSALLQIAEKVAYIDEHGEDYYDALDAALNAKALLSITAVYTQSGTVYDTDSLDSLKSDLVVTAYYDDGTSAVISSGYTLSGELTVGTSTITVTYSGKTTTFTVTVTAWNYRWTPSMGTLDSAGFTVTTNSGTVTYGTSGVTIVGVDNTGTCPIITNPLDTTNTAQVIEFLVNFSNMTNQSNTGFGLNVCYNGEEYVQFRAGCSTTGKCRYSTGTWTDMATPLLSTNTDYLFTVEYDTNANFVVKLDGVTILDVPNGTRTSSTINRFLCLAGTYTMKEIRVRTA